MRMQQAAQRDRVQCREGEEEKRFPMILILKSPQEWNTYSQRCADLQSISSLSRANNLALHLLVSLSGDGRLLRAMVRLSNNNIMMMMKRRKKTQRRISPRRIKSWSWANNNDRRESSMKKKSDDDDDDDRRRGEAKDEEIRYERKHLLPWNH